MASQSGKMVKKTKKQSAKATANDILQAIDQIVQAQNPVPHKTEQNTESKNSIDSLASQIAVKKETPSKPSSAAHKGLPAIPETMASTSYATKEKDKTSYQLAHKAKTPKAFQAQPSQPPHPPQTPNSSHAKNLPMLELTNVIDENGRMVAIPLLNNTERSADALLETIIPEITKSIQKQIKNKNVNQETLQNIIAQSAQESLAGWRRKNTVKKS